MFKAQIKATIELIATSAGGRKLGIASGYSPQFHFLDDPVAHVARITFDDREGLNPGEKATCNVAVMLMETSIPRLTVGTRFQMKEGSRLIGIGDVTSIDAVEEA